MSNLEGDFPTTLRGYDKAAVDDAIRDLRKEILSISAQNSQLANELRESQSKLKQALDELKEVGAPSYAGVGAKATLVLSTSEEMATRLLAEATQERDRMLAQAKAEADEVKDEAKGYYDALVAEAHRRAERVMGQARVDADDLMNFTRSEAARLTADANREAGAIRGATATEVAKLRASARRETESMKTKVERDLAERKLLANRDNTRELDMGRAQELVSEQARIDLELELTARRNEAEQEYLKKHQEAVAATQRYLDDANAQLSLALTRVNAARLEAETLEAAARSASKSSIDAARAKAEATIAAAEAEARNLVSEANLVSAVRIREAEARLSQLKLEQDSASIYLKNLKALVDAAFRADRRGAVAEYPTEE
ncbi:MAG: DivIVA domain-containing protein [Actinomycetales bacterium]|nr:DivIVA domain-containing protein [Actinomycetales bacterium]